MPGYMLTIIVATLLALNVAAQDDAAVAKPAAEPISAAEEVDDATLEKPEAESIAEAEEVDDADLDEQTYEDDDDGFVPTEEIPADEAIPFPTNI